MPMKVKELIKELKQLTTYTFIMTSLTLKPTQTQNIYDNGDKYDLEYKKYVVFVDEGNNYLPLKKGSKKKEGKIVKDYKKFKLTSLSAYKKQLKKVAFSIQKFLSISNDKHELASLVYPNFDSWTWSSGLKKEAKKVWADV